MGKRDQNNEVKDSDAKNIVQSGTVDGDVRTVDIKGDGATVVHGDLHGSISHTFGKK